MTFEPAGPAGFAPVTLYNNQTPDDPAQVLDGEPLRRMIALHQRAKDIHALMPMWEQLTELRDIKLQHENRIADLLRPRSEGGFGQPEEVGAVKAERKKLKLAAAELTRVQTLKEVRSGRWNAAARLERSVRDWLMDGGIPAGRRIEPVADAPLSELLTKNERIDAAVDRYRQRLRELAADLHRVRSSPWPSSVAKENAKAQIFALAEAAAPDIDRAIEHGLSVNFATMMQTAMVRGVETPAIATAETVDAVGLLAWLLRDQLVAKINTALDEAADDKAALSQEQREQMGAQITTDMLAVERSECSLIWAADRDGETVDFRSDTSPAAVIGVRLIAAPGVAARGTSAGHAFDLVGGRRR